MIEGQIIIPDKFNQTGLGRLGVYRFLLFQNVKKKSLKLYFCQKFRLLNCPLEYSLTKLFQNWRAYGTKSPYLTTVKPLAACLKCIETRVQRGSG